MSIATRALSTAFDMYESLMEEANILQSKINTLNKNRINNEEIIALIEKKSITLEKCDELYYSLISKSA